MRKQLSSLVVVVLLVLFLQIGVPQDAAHLLLLRIRLRLQHLDEKIVDLWVADHFEEEQVLQALETDRTDGWQAEQQLGEPARVVRPGHAGIFLESGVNFFAQQTDLLDGLEASHVGIEENDGPE